MTIADWLTNAREELTRANIASARLDAELILAHSLRKQRTYLHAHGDEIISDRHIEVANARLELRSHHTPIAYIIGHKEFYGRLFKTTPAALIPRPESETIITLASDIISNRLDETKNAIKIIDVGTGTGCLGITLKLEHPVTDVTLIDNSIHALHLAKENAALLGAEVHTIKNNLLSEYSIASDIVIANLPYVDRNWEVSIDTKYEPDEALYASNSGLSLIFRLLDQSTLVVKQPGYILIESDPRQQEAIINHAKSVGLHHKQTKEFITVFSR